MPIYPKISHSRTDSTDPINIHAHWASLASDVRSGDVGWWNSDLAGGQPTMKGGLPIFNLGYLVAPDWFAPGLVAAIRTLTAIGADLRVDPILGFVARVCAGRRNRIRVLRIHVDLDETGPHSSTAALMPGLVWALERLIRDPRLWRAVPLGGVAAAMAWTNFPQVTLYALLGAAIYVAIRFTGRVFA